jgi:hypothetical protein
MEVPEHANTLERARPPRIPLLHAFRNRRNGSHSRERTNRIPESQPASSVPTPVNLSRCPSLGGMHEAVPSTIVAEYYSDLNVAIVSHVQKFYTARPAHGGVSQIVIEHASTGMMIPSPQLRALLTDSTSTLATLSLCISWTILSRSLLLKLGISSSPGSSFLPPGIVECFQSISFGRGALTLEDDKAKAVDFSLLSRWKQITATLALTFHLRFRRLYPFRLAHSQHRACAQRS